MASLARKTAPKRRIAPVIRISDRTKAKIAKVSSQAAAVTKRAREVAAEHEEDLVQVVGAAAMGLAAKNGYLAKLPTVGSLDQKLLYGAAIYMLTRKSKGKMATHANNVAKAAVLIGAFETAQRGSLMTASAGVDESAGVNDPDISGAVDDE